MKGKGKEREDRKKKKKKETYSSIWIEVFLSAE